MNFNKKDKIEIFENAISWIVVFGLFIYGGAKGIQFDDVTKIEKTVSEMTGMELMWAFYGYSIHYALTLGFMEIFGGFLIMIKKTRIIGCLFASTILVNIILQDIFFEVNYGALKAALLYQVLLLIILWLNKDQLIQSLKTLIIRDIHVEPKIKFFVKLLITFFVFAVLRAVEYFLTIKS